MTTRDRMIAKIVTGLVVVLAAWFLVVSPRQDNASQLGDQLASARSNLASAQATLSSARTAQSQYAAAYTTVARLGEAVPADDAVPSLLVQLQRAATGSRIAFNGLQLTGAQAPPSTTPAAGAGTGQAVGATLPPGASAGPAGLPTMPFTFTFTGTFFHLADFFGRVQRFVQDAGRSLLVRGRLLTVNAISLAPDQSGFPHISATVSATAYLVSAPPGPSAGAAATAPAAALPTTATPSTAVATQVR